MSSSGNLFAFLLPGLSSLDDIKKLVSYVLVFNLTFLKRVEITQKLSLVFKRVNKRDAIKKVLLVIGGDRLVWSACFCMKIV
jgi:hypothetical protein